MQLQRSWNISWFKKQVTPKAHVLCQEVSDTKETGRKRHPECSSKPVIREKIGKLWKFYNIHPASRGVAAHTAGLFRSVRGANGGFPPWGLPKLRIFTFPPRGGSPSYFSPPWGLPKLGNFHFPPVGAPQAREFSLFPPWQLPKLGNFHFSPRGGFASQGIFTFPRRDSFPSYGIFTFPSLGGSPSCGISNS